MSNNLNIAFFGSSDFVIPILESIKNNQNKTLKEVAIKQYKSLEDKLNFNIKELENDLLDKRINLNLIVTQPNRKIRKKIVSNPVAKYARENGLNLYTPNNINNEIKNELDNINIGITASFGQIISEEILKKPSFGMINWHPSLLPKYRGPTPMQTALENGDKKTGLSWIEMSKRMDAGKVLLQIENEIEWNQNIIDLAKNMGQIGKQTWALATAIKILNLGCAKTQNNKEATFTKMLNKDYASIDFRAKTAEEVFNHWRAFLLFPKTKISTEKFDTIKLVELIDHKNNQELGENYETVFDSKEWLQIKVEKKLSTFLKCSNNTLLEVKKIGLENGKTIDFGGLELK